MKKNEYKCSACGGIFGKGWTDEEAEKEIKDIWGEIPKQERAVICDDCFHRRTSDEIQSMGEEYKNISNIKIN